MKNIYEQALKEQFKQNRPFFADNSWPDNRLDYYGFEVTSISGDGSDIDLNWVFKSGEKYCCTMLGCHTSSEKKWWKKLRAFLQKHGLNPPKLTFNVNVIIEPNVRTSLPTSPEEDEGYSYKTTWTEGRLADD